MSTRAAIYVRQSHDVQIGIERQLTLTRRLAVDKGWEVVGEYVDNETSAARVRGAKTAWAQMVAERDLFDAVVAVDLDRLLRSIRDLVTLVDLGVIVSTVSGDLDTTTSEGKFRATIMVGVAEFENGRRVERLKRSADQRFALGFPMKGLRPYGWETDMITLRPAEAQIIADATQGVISGVSLSSQVHQLNEQQLRAPRGGIWRISQFRASLLRERNAGRLVRNGLVQEVSRIQPAVTPENFDLCKSILWDQVRNAPARRKPEVFWLSSLMVCGTCHRIMRQARDGPQRQYLCESKFLAARDEICHVAIRAHIAEEVVRDAFLGWAADDGGNAAPPGLSERESIERRLKSFAKARTVATNALMKRGADRDAIETRLAAIAVQVDRLTRRRAWDITRTVEGVDWSTLTQPSPTGATEASRSTRLTVANTWWQKATWDTRREVVQALFVVEVVKSSHHGAKRVVVTQR